MYKQSIAILGAITTIAILYLISSSPEQIPLNNFYQVKIQNCTQSLAVECTSDIELTIRACSKAFDTKGLDIVADIRCVKDLLADRKNCWPCICYQAKKQGWHVIGC